MADDADMAQERMEREEAMNRPRPFALDFHPGDCELCGEWSSHLVNATCAPCRSDAERRARG